MLRIKQQTESINSVNLDATAQQSPEETNQKGFETLSWAEKERLVRTLCSQVNKGVAPKYWTQLNKAMRERENFLSKENSLNSYNLLGD